MKKIQASITLLLAFLVIFSGLTATAFAAYPHGVITIAFDDGTKSQYDYAYPMMRDRGMVGTYYIVSDFATDPDYADDFMTISDLHVLQDNGNEIGSHSKNHPHMSQSLLMSKFENNAVFQKLCCNPMGFQQ